MPPRPARNGSASRLRTRSSPMSNSRRASSPTTRKNSAIRPEFTNCAQVHLDAVAGHPHGELGRPQGLVAARPEIRPQQRRQGRGREDGGGAGLGAQELAQRGLPARRPRGAGSGSDGCRGAGLLRLGHTSIVAGGRIRLDPAGLVRPGRLVLVSAAWVTISRLRPTLASPRRPPTGATDSPPTAPTTVTSPPPWPGSAAGPTGAANGASPPRHYEQLAEAAEDAGQPETANGAWRRASLAWHWGKFVFVDDPAQQRAAHERSVACFRRAAPRADPARGSWCASPTRPPSWPPTCAFRRPRPRRRAAPARGDHGPRPRLDQGGAAGHGRVPAGPGDGHARDRRPRPGRGRIRPPDRAGLREGRHRRRRLPGHPGRRRWRQRRAVRHQPRRLLRRPRRRPRETAQAVVDLAGPYRLDLDWDELPEQTRATFRVRSGAASDDEARAKAGTLTLEEAAGEITTPLLILGGGRDRITPAYHQERLASEVASAELVDLPGRQPRRHQPRLRVPLPAGRLAGRPPARIAAGAERAPTAADSEAGCRVRSCTPPVAVAPPRVAAARPWIRPRGRCPASASSCATDRRCRSR